MRTQNGEDEQGGESGSSLGKDGYDQNTLCAILKEFCTDIINFP